MNRPQPFHLSRLFHQFRLSHQFRLLCLSRPFRRFRRIRRFRRFRLPAAMAVALMLAACGNEPETLDLHGRTMGTSYSVRIVVPPGDSPVALEALRQRVAARLEGLDNLFSTYRPDSEVSRFNAQPGVEWFGVSPDFLAVLEQSVSVGRITGGAFDATVGPLVELWGFGAGETSERIPDPEEVGGLLQATGSGHLQWRESPPAVRRTRPGVRLDFSAIAKGYAVDRIWELLSEAGLQDYLVEVGGEVRTRGRPADGRDWSIGIENPDGSGVADAVPLRDAAIATSGDYRNFFEHEGRRYSHVIDPRTGWTVAHDLASVTVVSPTAARADALATALLVLGPVAGMELAEHEEIAALLAVRADESLELMRSSAYQAFIGD